LIKLTARRLVAVLVAAGTVAGVVPAALAASAPAAQRSASGSGWRITYHLPAGAWISHITATSKKNAWATGCSGGINSCGRALSWHWDGRNWQQIPMGPGYAAPAAMAAAPDGTAWMFAQTSDKALAVLRWTGHGWTETKRWPGTVVFAAAAPDARHAWAFGEGYYGAPQYMFRYNGTTWSRTPMPFRLAVSDVTSVSATSIWAAGNSGGRELWHWNGSSWTSVPLTLRLPSGAATDLPKVAASGASDVWLAADVSYSCGNGCSNGVAVLHWDGTGWRQVRAPLTLVPGLNVATASLAPDGRGGCWLVVRGGHATQVLDYSGGQWTRIAAPAGLAGVVGRGIGLMAGLTWIPGTSSAWAAVPGGIAEYSR